MFFSVLGTALLGTTISGASLVRQRQEDRQSARYSEMGVDYVLAYVDEQLDVYRNDEGSIDLTLLGYDPNDFNQNFSFEEAFGALLSDSLTPFINGYTHPEHSFYVKYDPDSLVLSESNGLLEGEFTLLTQGMSGNVETNMNYTISVQASGIFDVMSYAVGAIGNIFLHGSSTIYGDIYVGEDLHVYDKAQVYRNGNRYVDSVYPTLVSDSSQILGDIYRITNISNYSNYLNKDWRRNIVSYNIIERENIDQVFSNEPPVFYEAEVDFPTIDITSYRNQFYINNPNVTPRFSNLDRNSYSNQLVYPRSIPSSPVMNYSQQFGGLHIPRSLQIRQGADLEFGWTSSSGNFQGGLYVDGDLEIGNMSISDQENDVSKYDTIRIKGPIFVDGDLTIRGADVEFDSTIYVTGSTEVRNSRLRGIQENGTESSLVLFGNEQISIANINSFENNRNRISQVRGFFYSNQTLEMYGAGSNLSIEGGIFAQNIILNALRGDAWEGSPYSSNNVPGSGWQGAWYFHTTNQQRTLSPDNSRLRITHNLNLVENPPEALPSIDNISLRAISRDKVE